MYQVVQNSQLYHCGYRWLVVGDKYEMISKHPTRDTAEQALNELNKRDTKILERVWSAYILNEEQTDYTMHDALMDVTKDLCLADAEYDTLMSRIEEYDY